MSAPLFVDALEIRWRNNLALRGNRAAFFGGILESSPAKRTALAVMRSVCNRPTVSIVKVSCTRKVYSRNPGFTDTRFRPLARRRDITFLPPWVFMRVRNPCFLTRLRRLGWNVRLGMKDNYS